MGFGREVKARGELQMGPDDEVCLCFHVTRRKIVNHLRIHKPLRASQLSECFGAGTGCGWCRPFLRQLFEQARADRAEQLELPAAAEYQRMRARYQQQSRARAGDPP
jgi:NAD(P)H-nitrite reductase large subunit